MKSRAVAILLILVGCGGALKDGDGLLWDEFMAQEEQAFGQLLGENNEAVSDGTAVDTVNRDFLAWMTLQPPPSRDDNEGDSTPLLLSNNTNKASLSTSENVKGDGGKWPSLGLESSLATIEAAWQQEERVRVGVLLPMSGSLSALGKHLWQASLLVLHRYSDRGDVSLFLYDTKGNRQGAKDAFHQAMASRVDIIIGPLLSSNLEEIRGMARDNVPVLSFSNNDGQAGKGIYIFGYTPEQQLAVLLDYNFLKGREKLAVLLPKTLYGREVKRSLDSILLQRGANYERLLIYDMPADRVAQALRGFTNYNERRALQRRALNLAKKKGQEEEVDRLSKRDTLGDAPFDSLLLVASDAVDLRILSSQLSFLDIDRRNGVQFLGLQGWEDFEGLNREPSLVGGWYVAPPESGRRIFEDQYKQVYGEKPLRLATLAFELVLLVSTIATEIEGGVNLQQLLEQPSGFIGIEGSYRFLPSGKVERLMNVMRVTNTGAVTEEQASPSFDLWDNRQRQQKIQKQQG